MQLDIEVSPPAFIDLFIRNIFKRYGTVCKGYCDFYFAWDTSEFLKKTCVNFAPWFTIPKSGPQCDPWCTNVLTSYPMVHKCLWGGADKQTYTIRCICTGGLKNVICLYSCRATLFAQSMKVNETISSNSFNLPWLSNSLWETLKILACVTYLFTRTVWWLVIETQLVMQ